MSYAHQSSEQSNTTTDHLLQVKKVKLSEPDSYAKRFVDMFNYRIKEITKNLLTVSKNFEVVNDQHFHQTKESNSSNPIEFKRFSDTDASLSNNEETLHSKEMMLKRVLLTRKALSRKRLHSATSSPSSDSYSITNPSNEKHIISNEKQIFCVFNDDCDDDVNDSQSPSKDSTLENNQELIEAIISSDAEVICNERSNEDAAAFNQVLKLKEKLLKNLLLKKKSKASAPNSNPVSVPKHFSTSEKDNNIGVESDICNKSLGEKESLSDIIFEMNSQADSKESNLEAKIEILQSKLIQSKENALKSLVVLKKKKISVLSSKLSQSRSKNFTNPIKKSFELSITHRPVKKSPNKVIQELLKIVKEQKKQLESKKSHEVQASSPKREKKDKYCTFYNRSGSCRDGEKCSYIHDSSRLHICSEFLRGECKLAKDCKLCHEFDPERLPDCKYHLAGRCQKKNCLYRHVTLSSNSTVCSQFRDGRCPNGITCTFRHEYNSSSKAQSSIDQSISENISIKDPQSVHSPAEDLCEWSCETGNQSLVAPLQPFDKDIVFDVSLIKENGCVDFIF